MSNPLIKDDEKTTAPAEAKKPQGKTGPSENELKLQAELDALKAGNKKFEEDTLAAALAKAGLTLEQFAAKEFEKKAQEEILECDIGSQVVSINGVPYTGRVQGKRGMIEMIQSMAGNARNQRMRELVGKEHIVEGLATSGIRTRVVKQFEDRIE